MSRSPGWPLARRVAGVIAALAVGALCGQTGVAQATSIVRGFADDVWFYGPQWNARTIATGAKRALLEIDWAGVEPSAPTAGHDPSSASDPEYNFGYVDAIVRQFAATGIAPVLLITDAPRWAQAPGGTPDLYVEGAWKPDVAALGQLAIALGRRYSGTFPDPLHPGARLPRVRYYQAWAEANFTNHLAPQWTSSDGRLVASGPEIYRGLLNAFYAGVKRAHADNVVIGSGLGPYGDLPGGERIPPAQFLRSLLCLNGQRLRPLRCPAPAHFDAIAINPYEVGPPTTRALSADDVSAPDLGKLTRIAGAALKRGTLLPRGAKPLWVTEFSYDSNPPNPSAVSLGTQARWLEQSMYVFWSEGVDTSIWYLLRDQKPIYNTIDYFSGVFFYGGVRKPSFEAYRFPLVVAPAGRGARVWGISPATGPVSIQRRTGGNWRTLFSLNSRAGDVFVHAVRAKPGVRFRAVAGGEASLAWTY